MNKRILILFMYLALLIGCVNSGGSSEYRPFVKERFYAPGGKYQGYSTESSTGTTRYYNTKSQYQGYSIGGKRK
jgi:hypothetical protein